MQTKAMGKGRSPGDGPEHGFEVSGRVSAPVRFDRDRLLAMDQAEVHDILLACGSGDPKGRLTQCRGVLLSDVINQVEVIATGHNDTKKMFIVAEADDGYKTVFSWQEIFNTTVGEGVMVLLERNNRPVHGDSGAVDLISTRDHLSGPRFVKRLARIVIRMLDQPGTDPAVLPSEDHRGER